MVSNVILPMARPAARLARRSYNPSAATGFWRPVRPAREPRAASLSRKMDPWFPEFVRPANVSRNARWRDPDAVTRQIPRPPVLRETVERPRVWRALSRSIPRSWFSGLPPLRFRAPYLRDFG